MMIYGHRFIESESFYHVLDIDSIKNTPPSSTIYLKFSETNLDIINYASLNNISMALDTSTVEELVYASALGAQYIVCKKTDAKTYQKIAETYLFDAKILAHIENDNEIENLVLEGIDGIIYSNAIIKINS